MPPPRRSSIFAPMRNLPKLPKIKLPKPHMVKPVKLKIPKQVKPNLPPHMQGQHTNHPASQQRSPAGALPPAPRGLPAPNTTYDFCIAPNDAPAAPDKSAIKAHLEAEFEMATQHAQNDANFRWTHRMYVQDTEDIRDTWPANPANKVYIPDETGTAFLVVFVETLNRNTPQQCKRVFLRRQSPHWPTDQI